jgi:PAT family beta-lactamase induction signal transducer AmpG
LNLQNPVEAQDLTPPVPPAWVIGLAWLPFGIVVGFTITALPFLVTRMGVSLDRAAAMSATVMTPTFWAFLLNPILDVGLTRRAYCWLTALVAAACMASGLWVLSPTRLGAATILLLLGELSIVLFSSALFGWQTEFVPERMRGMVGGWTNVANLGGGALGSLVVMSLASQVDARWIGLGLMVAILLGLVPALWFPLPHQSKFKLKQIFVDAMKATWRATKQRECLVGFALFLAPASSLAAINLFSGVGRDFHASDHVVILVTGAGCAISASIGSLIGGWASHRFNRGYVYLLSGIVGASCALVVAFLPHVPQNFVWLALAYNGVAGVSYAAFTSLCLQLVGHSSPVASTQLGLFSASTNGAIVFMTAMDGLGYRHFGVRGLLLTDGLASLAAAIPLLFLVRRYLRRAVMEEVAMEQHSS